MMLKLNKDSRYMKRDFHDNSAELVLYVTGLAILRTDLSHKSVTGFMFPEVLHPFKKIALYYFCVRLVVRSLECVMDHREERLESQKGAI